MMTKATGERLVPEFGFCLAGLRIYETSVECNEFFHGCRNYATGYNNWEWVSFDVR
jgi:hypothetical protein